MNSLSKPDPETLLSSFLIFESRISKKGFKLFENLQGTTWKLKSVKRCFNLKGKEREYKRTLKTQQVRIKSHLGIRKCLKTVPSSKGIVQNIESKSGTMLLIIQLPNNLLHTVIMEIEGVYAKYSAKEDFRDTVMIAWRGDILVMEIFFKLSFVITIFKFSNYCPEKMNNFK